MASDAASSYAERTGALARTEGLGLAGLEEQKLGSPSPPRPYRVADLPNRSAAGTACLDISFPVYFEGQMAHQARVEGGATSTRV